MLILCNNKSARLPSCGVSLCKAESGQFGLLPAMSPAGGRPAEQSGSLVVAQSTALAAKRISNFLQPSCGITAPAPIS